MENREGVRGSHKEHLGSSYDQNQGGPGGPWLFDVCVFFVFCFYVP